MPLVITLRTGESLYVADSKFTLARIKSEDKAELRRGTDGVVFEVSIYEKTEIEDDVLVQLGDRMTTRAARLAIDAPRSKLILLEDKYLRSNPG